MNTKYYFPPLLLLFLLNISTLKSQSWMPEEIVVTEKNGINWASMDVGPDQSIHVVWASDLDGDYIADSLYYSCRKKGEWLPPISYAKNTLRIVGVDITVDQAGVPHITWGEKKEDGTTRPVAQGLYYIQVINGQWSNPNIIIQPELLDSKFYITFDFKIITLPDNSLLTCWASRDVDNVFQSIKFSYFSQHEWSKPFKPFPAFADDGYSYHPRISNSLDSTLHLVFIGTDKPTSSYYGINYVRNHYSNKNWEQIESEIVYYTQGSMIADPQISVTAGNVRYIVWAEDFNNNYFSDVIYYSYSHDGISWSPPANISNSGEIITNPVIASDRSGVVHIMWQRHVYNPHKNILEIRDYYVTGKEDTLSLPVLMWGENPDVGNGLINLIIDADNREHIVWVEAIIDKTGKLQSKIKYMWRDLPYTEVKKKESAQNIRPDEYIIVNNYPNPFNNITKFAIEVTAPALITFSIYNLNGRLVKNLIKDSAVDNSIQLFWNGKDDLGNGVAAGLYYFRLKAESIYKKLKQQKTGKVILLK